MKRARESAPKLGTCKNEMRVIALNREDKTKEELRGSVYSTMEPEISDFTGISDELKSICRQIMRESRD
jgi:hypothetical protein